MPVYHLTDGLAFPPPHLAGPDGLLAIGGDLRLERLLLAYHMGIFPWYSPGEPILWWSPDPRLLLLPGEFHLPRRLARILKQGVYTITADSAFGQVMRFCAETPRPGQRGTWITNEMIAAYQRLHEAGFAHSIEAWRDGELAGGLYGVSLGSCFFGESMFAHAPNASKAALAALVERVRGWDHGFIDCQVTTRHLVSLGAREFPRAFFLRMLRHSLKEPTRRGHWELT